MNPPIISKADFEAAQMLIKKSSIEQRSDIVSRPLSQKIRCKCGAAYAPLRQLIECIKVMSADTIHIYFKDGTKIEATL